MSEHTDREYELEKQLFDVLFAAQQYLIEENLHFDDGTNRRNARRRLCDMVFDLRDNPDKYLQHPRWNES